MDNEELIADFIVESNENLNRLDQEFVRLEQNPDDAEVLSSIFRAVHTVKGTCGFFGFDKLQAISHVGENLLSSLRDRELVLTPEMTSALLRLVDALREVLASIEHTGGEGSVDYSALIEELVGLQTPQGDSADFGEVVQDMASDLPFEFCCVASAGEAASDSASETRPAPASTPSFPSPPEPNRDPGPALAKGREATPIVDSTLRVDVKLLDKLMNMVGELVLARNQTLKLIAATNEPGLLAASQRLNFVTTELQEAVMKTRMQPIGNLWSRFPRVVRDISVSLGKKVRLEMDGQETELDKTILEAIKDPLTHIIRNSVDHGLEMPPVRTAAGKPEEGLLYLRAYHEGGQVIIQITDDGAGINVERVAMKAVERGLVDPDQITRMSEYELGQLIFLPGFSTAEEVTSISGRGVGMDVVRTNIENVGGSIDFHSEKGKGTTLKIKIPLTLAIIPALIISCRGERYAIPQVSLLELVRLEGEKAASRIEMLLDKPMYRLRGNLLPLVHLHEVLGLEELTSSIPPSTEFSIIVLQTEERPFGLIVDAILDTEEIVVKPLAALLQNVGLFAGAAVMGDGRVAMILDVQGVAKRARVLGNERCADETSFANTEGKTENGEASMLLFRAAGDSRFAIPLSAVARLETFFPGDVESAGGLRVVQYRNQILHLVSVGARLGGHDPALDDPPREIAERLQVVVATHESATVGFVVDQILDITNEAVSVKGPSRRSGIEYTGVIQGRVVDFIDVAALLGESHTSVPEEARCLVEA